MYIVDTNALSENTKPRPNKGYMNWLGETDPEEMFVSCLSVGELQKGVLLAKDPARKGKLGRFVSGITEEFAEKIIFVDLETSLIWAKIAATAQANGLTVSGNDVLIAAQAIQHGATVVTWNIKDFEKFEGLKVLCPWSKA